MTQIIITLGAVVLLILVIGFFAMRYLRADDNDPFDEVPEERTTRSRGGEADGHDWRDNDHVVPLADRAGRGGRLGRRGGGDSGPAERDRSGAGRANQGRGPGGRQDREPAGARRGNAGDRGFDGPGFDGPGFDTGGFDSRGLDSRGAGDRGFGGAAYGGPGDTGAVGGRGADDRGFGGPGQADRGSRGGRGGEPPQQPRPAAASARSGRGKGSNAGGPDWDSMSDIDYWTELASDKPLTTTAQPAGPTGRPGQDAQPKARADRGTRPGRADSARADSGQASAGSRSAGSRPGSSRPGGPGQRGAAMPDDSTALLPRRHAPTGPGSVLPAARAGASAAELAGRDGRAVASAADSLSDRGGRSAARAARAAASGRDAGRPPADLGSRGGSYPDGRGGPAAGAGLSGRGPDPRSQDPRGQDPRSQDQSLSALARLGTPSGPGNGGVVPGRQAPLDDDPLTSPSFPAIRTADSRSYRRSDNSAGGGRGSRGPAGYSEPSTGGPAVTGGGSMSSGPAGNGATGNGIPPAPTAVYPTMTRPGSPDPRSAPRPGSGYDGGRSAGRPANWEGGYGQQAASAVNGHGAMNGHPAVNGSAADGGTGPNSYRPAAAPSGYQGYPEQPSSAPSGNPYGSYVSDPADSYQASRPNGDGGYGSYVSNAETQAYAQPSAIQPSAPQPAAAQPVHAAPVYENGTGYPAQGGGAAGYGASWPGGSGYSGQAQPGYQGGAPGQPGYAPSQPGYAAGHNGNGHNGAGHNGNGHNGNGHATGPYDQSSYPPPDGSGAAPDQSGYGGQDAGYGQSGYGSYPGY